MLTIDAKGKPCPMPVILAKKQIDAGENAFVILVDNSVAVENLTRLAENQGFVPAAAECAGSYAVSFVRSGMPDEVTVSFPHVAMNSGWAVFVAREQIGEGDAELGGNLMRMYFYTLTQSEQPPAAVLLMNSGVKLPCHDEQIVAHLQALIAKGTAVLVCGTCLNFYQIADQLQVGTVSNMYEIIEQMQKAGKVITL